jgi:hypothetical protein
MSGSKRDNDGDMVDRDDATLLHTQKPKMGAQMCMSRVPRMPLVRLIIEWFAPCRMRNASTVTERIL